MFVLRFVNIRGHLKTSDLFVSDFFQIYPGRPRVTFTDHPKAEKEIKHGRNEFSERTKRRVGTFGDVYGHLYSQDLNQVADTVEALFG